MDRGEGIRDSCCPAPKLLGKKVVLVFGSLELGGAERQGGVLARCLRDYCGCDVQVWGLDPAEGKLSQFCDSHGIRWKGVGFRWRWGVRHTPANLLALVKLVILLRREKPDLLLPYTFLPNLICGLAWRFTGAHLCIWNQADAGFFLERRLWHRLAVRLTPCFISNSEEGLRALLDTYRLEGRPVAVVANGVVLDRARAGRTEWRARLGVSEDAFLACMLANIHRFKDHATLLKAWRHFLNIVPLSDAGARPVLVLAGRQDEGEQALQELVKSLALHATVRFAGAVDDVAGLLEASDLCVHSSKSEGLPNAVLEAMATGLAVAGTDIEGIRRAVGPEGYPFLAPCGTPEALGERIAELFRNRELRVRQGAKMLERAREEFGVSRMFQRTVNFIEEGWPDR